MATNFQKLIQNCPVKKFFLADYLGYSRPSFNRRTRSPWELKLQELKILENKTGIELTEILQAILDDYKALEEEEKPDLPIGFLLELATKNNRHPIEILQDSNILEKKIQ